MRITPALAAAASVTAAIACLAATPATASAAPAPAAAHHQVVRHGFGFNVRAARAHEAALKRHGVRSVGSTKALRPMDAVPSSYSLQQYALTPGDQGQVGSCVTWATGYTGYGILMNEQGISGAPMAPMYIYSQIAQGNDTGTTASVALPMEQQQGIDTQSDYTQGNYDYTDQPTQEERNNAANYELSGFTDLTNSSDLQGSIEQAISSGEPVAIGFDARESFENLNSSDYNYDPSPSEQIIGGHEVTIVGYDDNGVTIENSWGTGWGDGGYFTAPWSWLTSSGDISEVHAMGGLATS